MYARKLKPSRAFPRAAAVLTANALLRSVTFFIVKRCNLQMWVVPACTVVLYHTHFTLAEHALTLLLVWILTGNWVKPWPQLD
jgi:hypothetical protein